MFGRQSHGSTGSSSSHLIEFRAGRMNLVGKMVHPDTRKGLVYLNQGDDGLLHFCWKDRTTGKVEDDLIIFPDDFEFKRVEQCKTGRVYVLKFKTSSRRMFFWMQEPKLEKDDEYCRRVNEIMNNPASAQRGGTNDGNELQYMLNNMSQQQLMQLFGGVGQMGGLSSLLGSMNRSGDTARTATTPIANRTATSAANSSGLLTPENTTNPRTPSAPKAKGRRTNGNGGNATGASTSENPTGRQVNIDLTSAISTSDAINQLVADPDRVNTLSVLLPDSEKGNEGRSQQIKDTIASPQFQQALTMFTNALQSAQLGPVVSQFELTPDAVAAAYSGNLEDFVKALEKALPAGATMSPSKKKDTTPKKTGEEQEDDSKPTEKKEE